MTSNRLKNLARIRLILSVIAVLLAGLMVVSGIMHFRPSNPVAEEPAESVPETIATMLPETTEVTEATEATDATTQTTVSTEATEETAKPTQPGDEHAQLRPEWSESVQNPSNEDDSPGYNNSLPNQNTGSDTVGPGNNNSSGSNGSHGSSDTSPTTPDDGSSSKPDGGTSTTPDNNTTTNPDGGTDTNPGGGSDANPGGGSDTNPGGSSDVNPSGGSDTNPDSGSSHTGTENNNDSSSHEDGHHNSDASFALSEDYSILYPTEESPEMPAAQDYEDATEDAETVSLTEEPIQEADPGQTETTAQTLSTEGEIIPVHGEDIGMDIWGILFWASAALLAIDLLAILLISNAIQKELASLNQKPRKQNCQAAPATTAPSVPTMPQIASIHQIGQRNYQQDSLGHTSVLSGQGLLAVLADGMGGLTNGEKVSQQIVIDALAIGNELKPDQVNGCLWKMVDKVNENTNLMLGSSGIYKSGSTLVAVLAYNGRFQWISVGDSRIYLFRQGYANQLNQDHDQLQVLMADVLSGRITMEDALRNPDGRKLTSFIGMGQLKYVDGSHHAISLEAGDRLILMSDGVYTIIGEDRLADILKRYPDVNRVATVMDRIIRDNNHPKQDNYTAIILGF